MGKCVNHPDRETSYQCMKHKYFLCEECLQCRDPEIYCKFRSSCAINFITRKGFESEKSSTEKEKNTEVSEKCSI